MFSHRKVLIRVVELVAAVAALAALLVALGVKRGRVSPSQVESKLLLALLISAFVICICVLLCNEFAKLRQHKNPSAAYKQEISFADLRLMLSWCPSWIKGAYVVAPLLLVYVVFAVGEVEWSYGQPFTREDALGFMLYISAFMFLAWPTLASASRMPGSYAEHFHPRLMGER